MVVPVDSSRIRKEIAKKYESDPKNWRLLWSIDKKGHYDFLVAKDSDSWWLKEAPINPLLSVGCGVKHSLGEDSINRIFSEERTTIPFGLRPVQESQLSKIITALANNEGPPVSIFEILRSEPKTLRDIETPFLMQGPIQHVPKLTDLLSDKQRELDAKLSSALKKMVLRRYPQLLMSYT
ncbi:MAG: hypothetical protein WED05_07050 [Candidatus Atabeyarchaeum deiterrae]